MPELATLVLQTPIVTDTLFLRMGSCSELTPTQLHKDLAPFFANFIGHQRLLHPRDTRLQTGSLSTVQELLAARKGLDNKASGRWQILRDRRRNRRVPLCATTIVPRPCEWYQTRIDNFPGETVAAVHQQIVL